MSVHHSVTLVVRQWVHLSTILANTFAAGETICGDCKFHGVDNTCFLSLGLRMLHNSLRHSTIYGYFQSGVTTFNVRFFSALLLICFSIGLVGRLVYFSSSSSSSSSSSWVYCYLNCIPFLGFVCYKSKPNLVIDVIFVAAVSAIFGIEVTDFSTDQ